MDTERKVVELNLNQILPNRFQPRIRFDQESINELCESIKEHGVIQPIVVRSIGDKYEIIAGERRYKASVLAGKQTIPAIVTNLDDKESAEVALIENVQRQSLTPIEEAISYKKILDMGYLTQEQLAEKLGKNQSTIANKLRLLNLTTEVQDALLNEKISERHARSLLKIADPVQQKQLLDKIIAMRLTVRKTDEEIEKMKKNNEIEVLDFGLNIPSAPVKEEASAPIVEEPLTIEESKQEDFELKPAKFDTIQDQGEDFITDHSNSYNLPSESIVNDFFTNDPVPDIDPVLPGTINPVVPEISEIKNTVNLDDTNNININIPSTPIIEEPVPDVESIREDEVHNPGFMDVDRIEQEAKDIYVEKPLANIDSLLQSDNQAPAIMEPDIETKKEPQYTSGKFFQFLSPVEDEKDNTIKESGIGSNIFNFTPIPPNQELPQIPEEDNQEVSQDTEENKEVFNNFAYMDKPEIEVKMDHPEEMVTSMDIHSAVASIRKQLDEIEKNGYKIDAEEFDFEDMYQFIIKISKQ